MTGNRNANKKEEINEGEMQIESVSKKKITINLSTLRQLTDILDHNCTPNRFAKNKLFSRFCQ